MNTTRRLLELPPDLAVRHLALMQLRQARSAASALDSETLTSYHDFRVPLRRLRTTLKVYQAELKGTVRGADRADLRQLSRLSNGRRNYEAQLALLPEFHTTAATEFVAQRLSKRLAEVEDVTDELVQRFKKIEGRLSKRLSRYRATLDPDAIPERTTFESLIAARGIETASSAMLALAAIDDAIEARALHAARLEVKRARYTIEPLLSLHMSVAEASRRLKRVQDLTGGVRDFGQLLATVNEALADASDELRAGLQEFAIAVQARTHELTSELQRLWLSGNGKWFFQRLLNSLSSIARSEAAPSIRRPAPRAAESPWRAPSSA